MPIAELCATLRGLNPIRSPYDRRLMEVEAARRLEMLDTRATTLDRLHSATADRDKEHIKKL
jgi:hypothetical protein